VARIGLLGGTFDPPHLGHLTVASDVCRALDLNEVWLVPAGIAPHKDASTGHPGSPVHPCSPVTAALLRLEMVRALVGDGEDRAVRVSDVEIARGGVSYSVDTLRALRTTHPDDEFFLIMGVDQFLTLSTWKDPEGIGRLATVVVMSREGVDPPPIAPGTDVCGVPVDVTRVDVSSTEVRRRVGRGEDVSASVGERVAGLIERHGLYGG
jgi:nicotinate-nucleotide adenylyltransferase